MYCAFHDIVTFYNSQGKLQFVIPLPGGSDTIINVHDEPTERRRKVDQE